MLEIVNISYKGIALGIGFHFVASIVLTLIVYFLFINISTLQLENGLADPRYYTNNKVRHYSLYGGALITIVMGMVAEIYSVQGTISNALIAGIIIILIHIVLMFAKPEAFNISSRVVIILCTVPLSCIGGWLLDTLWNI